MLSLRFPYPIAVPSDFEVSQLYYNKSVLDGPWKTELFLQWYEGRQHQDTIFQALERLISVLAETNKTKSIYVASETIDCAGTQVCVYLYVSHIGLRNKPSSVDPQPLCAYTTAAQR